ncbi:MAG: hypothetical protein J6S13_00255 [Clostridia bacterium]|nr:hypothetical protein [Clostridia bacterium]
MKKTLLLILLPIMIVCSFGGCFGGSEENTTENDDYYYVSAAKQAVADEMVNPSGASYNSSYVVEKDGYGRAIVYLDVSYQNSKGNISRDELYVCIIKKNDGKFYWRDYGLAYCSANNWQLSILKNGNNWGKPLS